MKITDVEAIVLRQPVIDEAIADGSQDDLIIRVHTDAGLTGIGEVDSSPELVASLVRARGSHAVATVCATSWSARTRSTSSGCGTGCIAA